MKIGLKFCDVSITLILQSLKYFKLWAILRLNFKVFLLRGKYMFKLKIILTLPTSTKHPTGRELTFGALPNV